MPLGLPYVLKWLSGQPSGPVGLCCTWSGSLCTRAAVFLQAVCSLDKGYKQTNKPTAIWSMRTHLLGCHLCKMESQAKESWQSSSCIVRPRVKAVYLLELQLSKRFQEDRNPLFCEKSEMLEMGDRISEQTSRKRLLLKRKEESINSSKETFQFLGRKKSGGSREINGENKNKGREKHIHETWSQYFRSENQ